MAGISGTRGGRVRVLVVDDGPALVDVLSVAVTETGRPPCPAADGQSALRTAHDAGESDLPGPSPHPPRRVLSTARNLTTRGTGYATRPVEEGR